MIQTPAAPGLFTPRVLIPFLLTGIIWGSTWFVITGQIGRVPASWSIVWRFVLATPAMFAFAWATGRSLGIGRAGHRLALMVGLAQFCGNFNFVYRAELHLTSGIVAVMFTLLMVPNALFAWALLGQRPTRRFAQGSAIALAGIALLLWHEADSAPPFAGVGGGVALGIAFALGGIVCASLANVTQANDTGRALPMASLLAWSMLYGTVMDIALAFATAGPPVLPAPGAGGAVYWGGIAWLALAGSVVTFPLHYGLVRTIGAGRAAYNGVVTVIVAMLLSTAFEDYRWTLLTVAGAALALAGMVVALGARRPVAARPVAPGGD